MVIVLDASEELVNRALGTIDLSLLAITIVLVTGADDELVGLREIGIMLTSTYSVVVLLEGAGV